MCLKKIEELFSSIYSTSGGVKIPRIKKYDSKCRLGFIAKKNHVAELYIYNWDTRFKALPASISKLAFLEILSIKNTCFKKLPNSLGKLASLKKLIITDSELTILPESIGKLEALEILDLHNNSIIKSLRRISLQDIFCDYSAI